MSMASILGGKIVDLFTFEDSLKINAKNYWSRNFLSDTVHNQ